MFGKKEKSLFCYGCGCLLIYVTKGIRAQGYSPDGSCYFSPVDETRHFCGRCVPPYDVIRLESRFDSASSASWEMREHYYKHQPDIEVDKQGKRLKRGSEEAET